MWEENSNKGGNMKKKNRPIDYVYDRLFYLVNHHVHKNEIHDHLNGISMKIVEIAKSISNILCKRFPYQPIVDALANLIVHVPRGLDYNRAIDALLWGLELSIKNMAQYYISIGKKGIPFKDIPGYVQKRAKIRAKEILLAQNLIEQEVIPLNENLF